MNDSINRKYMLVLTVLAVVVLAVGALLKPKKTALEPPSPSETASLQARVQREELGQTAAYFAQRAQVLAQNVYYDADHDSSAVIWEKQGQVLTAAGSNTGSFDRRCCLSVRDTEGPPRTRAAEENAGRWLLVVGRTANGQLLWIPAVYGGLRQAICSGESYGELTINARLDVALSGAGAFDLDGNLVAVVFRCDGNFHLTSVASVPRLL